MIMMIEQSSLTDACSPGGQTLVLGCVKGGLTSKGKIIPASAQRCVYRGRRVQANSALEGEVWQVVVNAQLQQYGPQATTMHVKRLF